MPGIQGQLLAMLSTVATALEDDLRHRLVFVGGCTTALLITYPVTLEDVRATDDVDLIIDLAGYAGWAQLQEQLQSRGFYVSPEDSVICRMRLGELKVDFMPDDPDILGFTNRWYGRGSITRRPAQGIQIVRARLKVQGIGWGKCENDSKHQNPTAYRSPDDPHLPAKQRHEAPTFLFACGLPRFATVAALST